MKKIISVSGVSTKREVLRSVLSAYINVNNRYNRRDIYNLADYLVREVINKQPENVEWSFNRRLENNSAFSQRIGSLVFVQQDITTAYSVPISVGIPNDKSWLIRVGESVVLIKNQGFYSYTAHTLSSTEGAVVPSRLDPEMNREEMRVFLQKEFKDIIGKPKMADTLAIYFANLYIKNNSVCDMHIKSFTGHNNVEIEPTSHQELLSLLSGLQNGFLGTYKVVISRKYPNDHTNKAYESVDYLIFVQKPVDGVVTTQVISDTKRKAVCVSKVGFREYDLKKICNAPS